MNTFMDCRLQARAGFCFSTRGNSLKNKTNKKTLLPSLPAQLGAADSLKMFLQRTHKEAFSSHILACACHAPVISSRASAANLQVDTG